MQRAMEGKTALVTGATGGIGLETAAAIAAQGARLLVTARDPARGDAAAAEIRRRAPDARVETLLADLSSQRQVRALAAEVQRRTDRLHLLVNNAGAIVMKRELTEDGLERTFATNHLAYFLLTTLLEPLLRASAPARIVNVASGAHFRQTLDLADLQSERGYAGMRVYGRSKLANILFTYELARRLEGSGVTANCLHPGVVATGFAARSGGWMELGWKIIRPFILTPAEGAKTSILLATSPSVEGVTGQYFVREKPARSSGVSRDPALARLLWEASERLTAPRAAPSA